MCFSVNDKLLARSLTVALLDNSERLASPVVGFPFKSISTDAVALIILASEKQRDGEQVSV